MRDRRTGFDVAKCCAIVLVVFGHVWRGLHADGLIDDAALFQRLDQAIYLFHMPVFFFLSGLFFSAALAPLAFLKSRVVVLLWPLLLWSVVDGLAKYAGGATHAGAPYTLGQALIPWEPTTGIFWFLWSLFFLSLIAYALAWLPRPWRLVAMAALSLAAILGLIGAGPFDSLWPVLIHMPEFMAGVALSVLGRRDRLLGPHLVWPGLALFLAGQALALLGAAQAGALWSELALALATLGFVLWVSNMRLPGPVLAQAAQLGQLTMPIYLTHILFTAGTRIALTHAGVDDLAVHLVLGTLLGLAGPMALYLVAQRLGLAGWVGFDRPAPARPSRLTPA